MKPELRTQPHESPSWPISDDIEDECATARARAIGDASYAVRPGGGCVGGLLTYSCNMPSTRDGGAASMACGNKIGAQKVTPMKLKQFPAHAIEPLQSSGA